MKMMNAGFSELVMPHYSILQMNFFKMNLCGMCSNYFTPNIRLAEFFRPDVN